MNLRHLLTAVRPYARPVLASVAIGWGLGVLADTVKERQAILGQLQEAIGAAAAQLDQLHTATHQLEERATRAAAAADSHRQYLAQAKPYTGGPVAGQTVQATWTPDPRLSAGAVVGPDEKERADEGTVDKPAAPVAGGNNVTGRVHLAGIADRFGTNRGVVHASPGETDPS